MKKKLTANIGLKIISVLAAFILWLAVVNTDDPMISRTYSGIPVEVINTDAITGQGKTFEILDNTNTISVIVHAKRSVIEDMSRDYIRATADMKEMSVMNTIPVDVRSTRYSDRIDSLTPVTKNVRVQIEDLGVKRVRISLETSGNPAEGYITGPAEPNVNILTVSGPASLVDKVSYAKAVVDVTGLKADVSTNANVYLYDENDSIITESMLEASVLEVLVEIKIYETKVVPVSIGHIMGVPADGFMVTGEVRSDPDSVRIAGSGENFSSMETLEIPSDVLNIAGASETTSLTIDAGRYLPSGVSFADPGFDGQIVITIYIGGISTKEISIPTVNISITNVPEGYSAVLVDIGGYKNVTVSGLTDVLKTVDPGKITGVINAGEMTPREGTVGPDLVQGSYDGAVNLNLPNGVTLTDKVYMEVTLNPIAASTLPAVAIEPAAIHENTELIVPTVETQVGGEAAPVIPETETPVTEVPVAETPVVPNNNNEIAVPPEAGQ